MKHILAILVSILFVGCAQYHAEGADSVRRMYKNDRIYQLDGGNFIVIKQDGNICYATVGGIHQSVKSKLIDNFNRGVVIVDSCGVKRK